MAINKPLAVLFLLEHNVFNKSKVHNSNNSSLIGNNHAANSLNTIKISYCHVRIKNNLIRYPAISG